MAPSWWSTNQSMPAAERDEVAELMAHEAARRAEQLGKRDVWVCYFERIAEVYGENACRARRHEPLLPLPRIADLLAVMRGVLPPPIVPPAPPVKSVPSPTTHTAAEIHAQAAAYEDEDIPF